MTLRIPKSFLIALAVLFAVGGLAVGGWFLFIRDTGPSDEELATQEEAEEQAQEAEEEAQAEAEAQAAADECERQLEDLLISLEDLQSRLQGVGVSYEEYGQRVGDVSAAYDQTPIGQLANDCVFEVGIHAENAVNSYVKAGNTWNECFGDINCETDSIDPELQKHWSAASASISQANRGLTGLPAP